MLRINGNLVSEDGQVSYGGMYMYESNDTITIAATNKYHMMAEEDWVAGSLEGWTFQDGTTGPIASFADYDATVSGTILATDVGHGLVTGDEVSIVGTTGGRAYDDIYTITRVNNDTFYFTNGSWVDTQTATWYQGAYLQASAGSAGKYFVSYAVTFGSSHASANNYKFELCKNSTKLDNTATESTSSGTEHRSVSACGIVDISDGDRLYIVVKNETDSDDIACEHANLIVHRM